MTKDQEDAWLAGLFDGEGCFNVSIDRDGCLDVRAMICNTYIPLLERIEEVMGFGHIDAYPTIEASGSCRWRCSRANVSRLLDRIEPYLIVKKDEAEIIRAMLSTVGTRVSEDLLVRQELLNVWQQRGRRVGSAHTTTTTA